MNFDLEQELTPALTAHENFQWTGRPKTGLLFRKTDLFMVPFSLLWGGFAIFWEIMAFAMGTPFFFKLWGIPFVLVGLYLIFGRFFVDARIRAKTIYGITQDRVIIRSGLFTQTFQSLQIKTLPEISYTENADLSGTITFGPLIPDQNRIKGMIPGTLNAGSKLEMIPDVKAVYDLLIRLQKQ
ncbi:MAG: hypothetical protein JNJ58_01280 [Chitinophagaceae bacterium]|nr:hypothetical protein [Chitinophagaceae bacterium]